VSILNVLVPRKHQTGGAVIRSGGRHYALKLIEQLVMKNPGVYMKLFVDVQTDEYY